MSDIKNKLKYFRQLLIERQNQLQDVAGIGDAAADVVELDQSRVGRLSRMDAMRAQAMSQDAKQRREIEIQKISQALKRIESKEYGYCLSCGEMISEKRLQVDPSNPLCINCAK